MYWYIWWRRRIKNTSSTLRQSLHPYFPPTINKIMHNTLCPSWQELPKSTILMALLLGLHSRMFSGFRSQWMMLSSGVARNSSAVHNCWANFRVRFKETPLKFVFRNKSYKLYDSISNTKQRWFRNMKCRFKCTEERNIRTFICLIAAFVKI